MNVKLYFLTKSPKKVRFFGIGLHSKIKLHQKLRDYKYHGFLFYIHCVLALISCGNMIYKAVSYFLLCKMCTLGIVCSKRKCVKLSENTLQEK